ncbi:MAG: hypothetical protein RR065_06115, partial [Clostridia bacterium]
KYLPLKGFKYSELDSGSYADLEPCASCSPVKRKSVIDEMNAQRGLVKAAQADAAAEAAAEAEDTAAAAATQAPKATDVPSDTKTESSNGVVITIKDGN